jgi:hypothetical protein
VKKLALYGLGLKLYQGEDIPSESSDDASTNAADQKKATTTRRAKATPAPAPQPQDRFSVIKNAIASVPNTDALLDLYLQHQNEVEGNAEIKRLFSQRKLELRQAA